MAGAIWPCDGGAAVTAVVWGLGTLVWEGRVCLRVQHYSPAPSNHSGWSDISGNFH